MNNFSTMPKRSSLLGTSFILAAIFVTFFVSLINANDAYVDANLANSTINVNKTSALAGSTLDYTVVISNTGDNFTVVVVTDTLPVGLTYVPNSLSSPDVSPIMMMESNGTISWQAALNPLTQARIQFQAVISTSVTPGTVITNTAMIGGDPVPTVFSVHVATTVISEPSIFYGFLPLMTVPLPKVTLNPIPAANGFNQWTVNWSYAQPATIAGFELQEANNVNFTNATTENVGMNLSSLRAVAASPYNISYYRVRSVGSNGAVGNWSNIQSVVGAYYDDFSATDTGWTVRRHDTDDVNNQDYYENGHFVLEMDSRWDYQMAGPMMPAPVGGRYRIDTRVRLTGVDNLQSYGIIFGGDWDGTPCPNVTYTSCFNHYYRFVAVWNGSPNEIKIQLKRIDYHSSKNEGRGVDIVTWMNVPVNSPSETYQEWGITLDPSNGKIEIYVNGVLKRTAYDLEMRYVSDPYFAAFAATDEYTGLNAEYDWWSVVPLD